MFMENVECGSGNDIFGEEHTHRSDLGVQQPKKEHTPDQEESQSVSSIPTLEYHELQSQHLWQTFDVFVHRNRLS